MKTLERYDVVVKENTTSSILKPSIIDSRMTIEDVIKFFGLEEPDVDWYEIYKVYADGTTELVSTTRFEE